jgi:hypothetical protein
MNKFDLYLTEAGLTLTHLEHIEDLIILDGVEGIKTGISFLKQNVEILRGNGSMDIQRKFDGAPSLIAGINPENGKFFVATKSLFNKDPKINYTEEDIDTNHGDGGLAETLKVALSNLSKLGIKNVIQGDVMFTKKLLSKQTIDGIEYLTFRPNTIVYAVPYDSPLAKHIMKTEIGMAWHTSYSGTSIEDLNASFNIDISSHRDVTSVYNTTTNIPVSNVMLSDEDYNNIMNMINDIEADSKKFDKDELTYIGEHSVEILAYINSKVKIGQTVSDSMVKGLIDFVTAKYEKDKDRLKSDSGKQKVERQKIKKIQDIRSVAGTLWYVLKTHQAIQEIKRILINKFDMIAGMSTFVETDSGFKATSPEGYVAVDKLKGGAVKLVDRLEFSKNNFTILKKWKN